MQTENVHNLGLSRKSNIKEINSFFCLNLNQEKDSSLKNINCPRFHKFILKRLLINKIININKFYLCLNSYFKHEEIPCIFDRSIRIR